MENKPRDYNQLKREVLSYLQTSGTVTTKDVSRALNIEIANAGMVLLKLRRQGLVDRWPFRTGAFNKPQYQYNITERGIARHAYYLSHTHKKGDV